MENLRCFPVEVETSSASACDISNMKMSVFEKSNDTQLFFRRIFQTGSLLREIIYSQTPPVYDGFRSLTHRCRLFNFFWQMNPGKNNQPRRTQRAQRFVAFLCVLCELCGFSNQKIGIFEPELVNALHTLPG